MIRLVEAVVAPATVAAVDIFTLEVAPDWNEWASYIMAAGGYVGGFINFGGPFVEHMGIASLDWAARSLYQRVRSGMTKKARRKVFAPPRSVERSYQPEFEAVAPQAF